MNTNSLVTVLDPVAPAGTVSTKSVFQPLDDLKGKVIGFIDNSKPNFSFLLDDIAELLKSRHGVARVVKHQKLSASRPAPEAVIADVVQHCNLVITGSGD